MKCLNKNEINREESAKIICERIIFWDVILKNFFEKYLLEITNMKYGIVEARAYPIVPNPNKLNIKKLSGINKIINNKVKDKKIIFKDVITCCFLPGTMRFPYGVEVP